MKLSPAQVQWFWKLSWKAWKKEAKRVGASGEEARLAFVAEQLSTCGFAVLDDVDATNGFDAVMLLLAQIAEDERAAEYFAVGAERRMRHLIGEALAELSRLCGHLCDWRYARGIMDHMHLAEDLADVPVEQLFKVFQSLDTHLRRVKHRGHEKPQAPHGHHEEAA